MGALVPKLCRMSSPEAAQPAEHPWGRVAEDGTVFLRTAERPLTTGKITSREAILVEATRCFAEHGYDGSVIFGHAKDGNVHFLLNERFDDEQSLARYRRFTGTSSMNPMPPKISVA